MTPDQQARVLEVLQEGLPLVSRPYAALARQLELSEAEVTSAIEAMTQTGVIRRFGVVVRHRDVGIEHNAMVVFDVPDALVGEVGRRLRELPFVTLCYSRRRSLPTWPFNLYCMIHGASRAVVEEQVLELRRTAGSDELPHRVLFSRRCFKQHGARFGAASPVSALDRALIERLQDGIGVEERPFAAVAEQLGLSETEVVERLTALRQAGVLTRFGPMLNVERMGGEFTLVAMSVPDERFEEVASLVNAHKEVAHNYEREHALNMWFVVATAEEPATRRVLDAIERETGLRTYAMPKLEEYFLRLRLAL